MALTKQQKQAQVQELTTKLKEAKSVMFSHYTGLSVGDVSDLRGQLLDNDAEMKVAKKTLMQLAFKEAGYPDIGPDDLEGPVACIFSFADAISGAQTAFKFSKNHEQIKLIGGVFDGKVLTAEQALELAKMASREELLAKFVGMLQSPLVSFTRLSSSPLSGFARALDQMAEKGGFAEEDAKETKEAEETKEKAPTDEPKPDAAAAESENTDNEDSSDSSASSDSSDSPKEEEEKKSDDAA